MAHENDKINIHNKKNDHKSYGSTAIIKHTINNCFLTNIFFRLEYTKFPPFFIKNNFIYGT